MTLAFSWACSTTGSERFRIRSANAERAELVDLVRFGDYVRTLHPARLEERYTELVAQHVESPTADTAIRLALLVSNPASPRYSLDDALDLLSSAREDGTSDQTKFARLLYELIGEQRAAGGGGPEGASLASLLAQERDRNHRLDAELAVTRTAMETERRARIALAKQLEALKGVEEQIKHLDP